MHFPQHCQNRHDTNFVISSAKDRRFAIPSFANRTSPCGKDKLLRSSQSSPALVCRQDFPPQWIVVDFSLLCSFCIMSGLEMRCSVAPLSRTRVFWGIFALVNHTIVLPFFLLVLPRVLLGRPKYKFIVLCCIIPWENQ